MASTEIRYRGRVLLISLVVIVEVFLSLSLAFLCASLGSAAYSDVSFTEISVDGTAVRIEDGRKLMEDWTPPTVAQERFLKVFIQSLRSVKADNQANIDDVGRVAYRSLGQAYSVVSAYLSANQPIPLSQERLVDVPLEDIELTRYGGNTWKIVWREIVTDAKNGSLLSDRQYEAVVYTSFSQPETEDERIWNPLGMYITYMDSDLLRSYI